MADVSHTTELLAKTSQYGGMSGTIFGTMWAWVGQNAVHIGAACAIVSMVCTVWGTRWIIKHKKYLIEADKAERARKRREDTED